MSKSSFASSWSASAASFSFSNSSSVSSLEGSLALAFLRWLSGLSAVVFGWSDPVEAGPDPAGPASDQPGPALDPAVDC